MEISFSSFCEQVFSNPVLMITVLLTLGVIFVNGWTDAPNAIATCIATRCMKVRTAIMMSAVFNFLGVLVMTKINSAVASTISNMVDFGGETNEALIALCAALFSIVVYSVAASVFGIPTSESHSLIAGLSGAAIAIHNGVGGINFAEWAKDPVRCRRQAQDRRIFQGSADFRRCIYEFYARGTGWPEVHRRPLPGDCFLQRPEQC